MNKIIQGVRLKMKKINIFIPLLFMFFNIVAFSGIKSEEHILMYAGLTLMMLAMFFRISGNNG